MDPGQAVSPSQALARWQRSLQGGDPAVDRRMACKDICALIPEPVGSSPFSRWSMYHRGPIEGDRRAPVRRSWMGAGEREREKEGEEARGSRDIFEGATRLPLKMKRP